MLRYARLYLYFLRFSFSRAMEFRVDFFFRVVMDLIYYAVNLAFFTLIYRTTSLLGGWNLDQIYVFVCGFLLVDAVHMTVFSSNFWWLPKFINRGDLDYYLVRPVSSLFFLSCRDFAANSFLNLVCALALMAWSIGRYPEPLGTGKLALYFALIGAGCLVHYYLNLAFLIPVFWVQTERGLGELFFVLGKLMERPHQIFASWLRIAVVTVLPFGVIASVPAHALFGDAAWQVGLHVVAVTTGLGCFVIWFWRRGLAAYGSASS